MLIEIPGFVLRQVAYKNHDGILTLLTPEGYLTVLGRGILKMTSPFAATTSLGTWATFTLKQTKQKYYLENATLLAFPPLAESTGMLASMIMQTALYIALLHDDQEEGKNLYPRLKTLREHLRTPMQAWANYLIAYLQQQGVPIVVAYCVRCQKTKGIVAISTYLGGFVCQTCLPHTDATTLPASALKALLDLHRHPENVTIEPATLAMLIPLVHQHFLTHLEIPVQGFTTIETLIAKIHS